MNVQLLSMAIIAAELKYLKDDAYAPSEVEYYDDLADLSGLGRPLTDDECQWVFENQDRVLEPYCRFDIDRAHAERPFPNM